MSVRVVARIRPLLESELDKDIIVTAASNDDRKTSNVVKIPSPKNEAEEFSFAFNSVYDNQATQEHLFTAEVAPHLKSLFQGLDVTIFAYGVTGTGKTHTMRGGLKLAERGVIPRLLSGVFRRAKKITKDSGGDTTVSVALSYYEIYNDKVFDLLEPLEKRTPSGLPLRAEANGKTVVAGLSERPCEELKDFERLYIESNINRVTAATKLNAHSSRSHAILRVKVTQVTGDMVHESTASAIDLAGSEDNRRTDNGKERLVESAAINKSLFVLSQCIDAISRGERRIPFRESKMTRILSLGQNNGITIMILNLAPLRSYHLDTLSSLNVSSRAKRIEVREIENEIVYKQAPRMNSNSSATGMARQPLRPLANAHNIHSGAVAAAAAAESKPSDRPVKAFNVYTDKLKPIPTSRPGANTAIKRTSNTNTQKRISESDGGSRPSKITRPEIPRPTLVPRHAKPSQPAISADLIEAMVEKKVSEILASRTQSAPVPPEVNDEVQKRLEALERRIEDGRHDDTRSEGLRFLLMARQRKERGQDASALKMYEMALPFFPGQAKLIGKIEKLKARLEDKKDGRDMEASDLRDDDEQPVERKAKKSSRKAEDIDDYIGAEADVDDESFVGRKKKGKKSRAVKVAPISTIEDGPSSQDLLDIINSRDVAMIMSLQGFGPKKARDLVDYLELMSEGDGGLIASLTQLRTKNSPANIVRLLIVGRSFWYSEEVDDSIRAEYVHARKSTSIEIAAHGQTSSGDG
ncbi:Uu.00g145260.m01.CDS01 [Anthostomella pinea]|uniref:Uu.00g145260.m01.CDS01 n=1 Tax=Anthostomella pinea TaxID=933095 RepID=A0AAI8YLZ2_9PEZI|nr:Uu.00g145260.m01.CDS01 [Anthostomella pinea]